LDWVVVVVDGASEVSVGSAEHSIDATIVVSRSLDASEIQEDVKSAISSNN
jgi:hypothetical protein